MKFDPKDAEQLIPDGEYDAQIMAAEEKRSNAGNDMLKLTLKVWANGTTFTIFDYIAAPKMTWKLKQLCSTLGMMAEFEAGEIDAFALDAKMVRVFIKTQKGNEQYPDRNVVAKYVEVDPQHNTVRAAAPASADDDLMF